MRRRYFLHHKGQSIVEVLVATSVAMLVLTAMTSAVLSSLVNTQTAKSQNLANQYAQEAMELVRSSRLSAPGTYCLEQGNSIIASSGSDCKLPNINGGSDASVDTDKSARFIRSVVIKPKGCAENVNSVITTVSWDDGKCGENDAFCHEVKLDSCVSVDTVIGIGPTSTPTPTRTPTVAPPTSTPTRTPTPSPTIVSTDPAGIKQYSLDVGEVASTMTIDPAFGYKNTSIAPDISGTLVQLGMYVTGGSGGYQWELVNSGSEGGPSAPPAVDSGTLSASPDVNGYYVSSTLSRPFTSATKWIFRVNVLNGTTRYSANPVFDVFNFRFRSTGTTQTSLTSGRYIVKYIYTTPAPTATPTRTPTPTPTRTPTPTVTPVPQTQQLLANAGFESQGANWIEGAGDICTLAVNCSSTSHGGSWLLWLGYINSVSDVTYQTVALPATTTAVKLQYWYRIYTLETAAAAYDTATVKITTSTGSTIKTVKTYSNLDKTTGTTWVASGVLDIPEAVAHKGQNIRVQFAAVNDATDPTGFGFDDVALNVTY